MNDLQQSHAPAPPSAVPEELDTETPAFGAVTRFTQADWPRYATWLAVRLKARFPAMASTPEATVPRLLTGHMQSNDTAMFKTTHAVGLFRLLTRPFDTPVIDNVFIFTDGPEFKKEALWIIREAETWGRRLGAAELWIDSGSDLTPGKMKALVYAKERTQLYRDLTVEKKA